MTQNKVVHTKNVGMLKIEKGFRFLRGVEFKGQMMGYARDRYDKKRYRVYPAECELKNRCYCSAKAVEVEVK